MMVTALCFALGDSTNTIWCRIHFLPMVKWLAISSGGRESEEGKEVSIMYLNQVMKGEIWNYHCIYTYRMEGRMYATGGYRKGSKRRGFMNWSGTSKASDIAHLSFSAVRYGAAFYIWMMPGIICAAVSVDMTSW